MDTPTIALVVAVIAPFVPLVASQPRKVLQWISDRRIGKIAAEVANENGKRGGNLILGLRYRGRQLEDAIKLNRSSRAKLLTLISDEMARYHWRPLGEVHGRAAFMK